MIRNIYLNRLLILLFLALLDVELLNDEVVPGL